MNEKIIEGICLAFVFGMGLAGYISLFMRSVKTKDEKFIEKAKEEGHYIIARKVHSKWRPGRRKNGKRNHPYYIVKYEYSVNGKKYTKKLIVDAYRGKIPRDEVKVYYNLRRPGKGITQGEAWKKGDGCFFYAVKVFIAAAVLYQVLIRI